MAATAANTSRAASTTCSWAIGYRSSRQISKTLFGDRFITWASSQSRACPFARSVTTSGPLSTVAAFLEPNAAAPSLNRCRYLQSDAGLKDDGSLFEDTSDLWNDTPTASDSSSMGTSLLDVLSDPANSKDRGLASSIVADASGSFSSVLLSSHDTRQDGDGGSSLLDLLKDTEIMSSVEDTDSTFDNRPSKSAVQKRRRRQRVGARKKLFPEEHLAASTITSANHLISIIDPPRLQSRRNAALLFASFAPHVDRPAMLQLRKRLDKFSGNTSKNMEHFNDFLEKTGRGRVKGELKQLFKCAGPYENGEGRMGMVDSIFNDMVKKTNRKSQGQNILSLESHGWMKPLFSRFFSYRRCAHEHETGKIEDNSILLSEPSFPPNLNRRHLKKNIEILMKVRERCLGSDPFFWSLKKARRNARSRARKKDKELARMEKVENRSDLTVISNQGSADISESDLPPPKLSRTNMLKLQNEKKSEEELRNEAANMANLLADRLPCASMDRLINQFELYCEGDSTIAKDDGEVSDFTKSKNTSKKHTRITRILPTFLRSNVKDHVHLVAADIADFLYVDIPDSIREKDTVSAASEVKDTMVASLLKAQHTFVAAENLWRKEMERRKEESKEDDGEDSIVGLFASLADEAEEREIVKKLTATFKRKGHHVIFDAMLLSDRFAETRRWKESGESPTHDGNTIFVDCLPIDATEEEVCELYSRCGPIKAVRLFNLQPDLDPGIPSPAKLLRQRKKKRRAGAKSINTNAERKRSPVYAMITFETEEGANNASIDPLRIFGMVIRRHPVRTIRARDATTLHLEHIPRGLYCRDLEERLSHALDPDIHISLDIGQNDYTRPASCEIRFPNFDSALHAFNVIEKIEFGPSQIDDEEKDGKPEGSGEKPGIKFGPSHILDEGKDGTSMPEGSGRKPGINIGMNVDIPRPECSLQWMKTPDDAVGYWTRQLNFDP